MDAVAPKGLAFLLYGEKALLSIDRRPYEVERGLEL
jgi:hypothetical protein